MLFIYEIKLMINIEICLWITAEDKQTTINVLCGALAPNDPALLEARSDALDDDVTSTSSPGNHNDLMAAAADGGLNGHTTGKLTNDIIQPMTTERGVKLLDDGGDLKSGRRPTKSPNDGWLPSNTLEISYTIKLNYFYYHHRWSHSYNLETLWSQLTRKHVQKRTPKASSLPTV